MSQKCSTVGSFSTTCIAKLYSNRSAVHTYMLVRLNLPVLFVKDAERGYQGPLFACTVPSHVCPFDPLDNWGSSREALRYSANCMATKLT